MPVSNSDSIFIIAEIAQAHDGSLGTAHAYIDLASKSGVDAVKFQTHIASAESTIEEPWRVKFSKQDKTRYDYWKRMEFTKSQWIELKEHAEENKLEFISSPFSVEAAELLIDIGIKFWKVASGEVNNTPLFDLISKTGLPILLSTGMSPMSEIDKAVDILQKDTDDITVMQCTSMYPTPSEKLGLNMLDEFRQRYNCKVGLSDHSGDIYAGLAAAAMGADSLEVHLTMSKDSFGPDVPVSLTGEQLRQLSEGARYIKKALSNPVSKDDIAEELIDIRKMFNKSIVAKSDIKSGTVITDEHLSYKKPGNGLPPEDRTKVIGKRAKKELKTDQIITLEDIE